MHADNSAHLNAAVQKRHSNTRRKALDTLDELRDQRQLPVTVSGLARAAGVARSWIYTQPDILARIKASNSYMRPALPTADERPRHDPAHQRMKALLIENQKLREQLAHAHRQLRMLQRNGL
ncbi:DUF6262 family protein [Gordonia sp. DT218]|uniref:DUF6262 family protein n=1 Tax=Gordonia sp. DT218 TaxID=3416659 RepID=UPI003CE9BCB7